MAVRAWADALALARAKRQRHPGSVSLAVAEAGVLLGWGRGVEAARALRGFAEQSAMPDDAIEAARVYFQAGDYAAAERCATAALAEDARNASALATLAASLHARGDTDSAEVAYRRLLDVDADSIDALLGLGNCLLDARREAEALPMLRRALEVDPRNVTGWIFLGSAYDRLDREGEALDALAQAVAQERALGADEGAEYAEAAALASAGRLSEAIGAVERWLRNHPVAKAYVFYSHALLTVGRMPAGWWFNEFRWLTDYFVERKPRFDRPEWNGQNLRGRHVLLHVEQGIGDAVQFVRYAPSLKALGATVSLTVRPEMRRLFAGAPGVDHLVEIGRDPLPDYDFYIHLLSLPNVFRTDIGTLPGGVPYLTAPQDSVARWAPRFADAGDLRVGLVWSGNPAFPGNRARSLPLAQLAPLGTVSGARFYSLQKGPPEVEAAAPPTGLPLTNLSSEIEDLTDTAAVIAHLDVVITVCTSVAHLAGAMGRETWVLLASSADWRWLQDRDDSPWYPAARLFRQSRRGDWSGVVDAVAAALRARVAAPRRGLGATVPCGSATVVPLPRSNPMHLAPHDVSPGLCAVAQTRHGVLQYLPHQPQIGLSLGWYGEWLQPQLDLLCGLVGPDMHVVETGAGVGAHAVALARRVGEGGLVLAYEDDPLQRRILQENLWANRLRHVTPMRANIAGGDETIDDLQLDRLDCLKIGADADRVLAGASDSLWRLRPTVFVATASNVDRDRVLERLREHGYRCWRMDVALFDPANFNRRDQDLFDGARALALLAIPEEVDVRGALIHCVEAT
ncbi:MAG: tetratricopeptide repeat protein [Burkholderiales bacterium]